MENGIELSTMKQNIDTFINDLLHIDNVNANKLLDLAAGKDKAYYLYADDRDYNSREILKIIGARIGKLGNTVLRGSALAAEQMIGRGNALDWSDKDGDREPKALDNFIKDINKELELKGNNPLFLGIGAVTWRLAVSASAANPQVKEVETPLLIFPIRLIRSVTTRPINIEFIDDEIYVNPCFIAKLRQVYGEEVAKSFPHPSGSITNLNAPINLESLGTGEEYFASVEMYINKCRGGSETVFSFNRNTVAISKYNHDEICMYYDILRNKDKIYAHPLVQRLFTVSPDGSSIPKSQIDTRIPSFIKEYDSSQERMIKRVLSGESLVIKGPPGTGKTLTIVNMISSLLSDGKKVMLVSKKLAALSEVYKKLPDELRDFVMLLDCETEAQAANLSPAVVKRNFASLLRVCKEEPRLTQAFYDDLKHEQDRRSLALRTLAGYFEETFKQERINIIGCTYFEAIDTLLKNEDIETVEFIHPGLARQLNREQFNMLKGVVSDAGAQFKALTGGNDHPYHAMLLSPWYAIGGEIPDSEKALTENGKLMAMLRDARSATEQLFSPISSFRLSHISALIAAGATPNDVYKVAEKSVIKINRVRECADKLAGTSLDIFGSVSLLPTADVSEDTSAFRTLTIDKSISLSDLEALYAEREVLSGLSADGEKSAREIIAAMDEIYDERIQHAEKMRNVFRGDLTDEELAKIDKAYSALDSYVGTGATAPKMIDFLAKKAYANLSAFSYLPNPSFAEIVDGAAERHAYTLCDERLQEKNGELCRIFKAALTTRQLEAIALLIHKTAAIGTAGSAYSYMRSVSEEYESVTAIAKKTTAQPHVTVAMLEEAFTLAERFSDLRCAMAYYESDEDALPAMQTTGFIHNKEEYAKLMLDASRIVAIKDFISHGTMKFRPIDELAILIPDICRQGADARAKIEALLAGFRAFGKSCFKNYYSEFGEKIIFSDLDIFEAEAINRDTLHAAETYFRLRNDGSEIIANFFHPFEYSERQQGEHSFEEIFEHSVFDLAIRAILSMLPLRNGRGKTITDAMAQYADGDTRICDLNVKQIRDTCVRRIDPADGDFAFLNAENDTVNNLRKIFKLYANAILKLKKCFLLSPSTVSVLFGNPAFADFDVVIVDEASQLEPTTILPILFRTKQCVFVGDEYQMPPISHFTTRTEHAVTAGDEQIILSPETSLLSLATQSNHFDVEKLQCHFRSKTESLIAFSQERFYPFMRTFPSPIPKAPGLGFKDIYIPDGEGVGGKNDREARAVITELYDHFDRYYNKDTGELSESVGVVAFGEAQVELIKRYVKGDPQLKEMIDTAISHFDDLPEKLIFFKTVETVQGQEIDHLILSLTYSGGSNFGDLSRKSIGGCVFNVAVTRARASVTMIHSLRPMDTTNETVHDYLEISEKFSKDGRMQFISSGESTNFIKSVVRFLTEEVGIDSERIVVNCGATEGSVKIPIAVLSPDGTEAKLGIFCESPHSAETFIDANIRYYNILKSRGWNMHRIYIHDWVDNAENEKKALIDAIGRYVN